MSALLNHKLPNELYQILLDEGVNVFPSSHRDLDTDCNCPDYATICKHIAGLVYMIAMEIDKDPFLLVAVQPTRGLDVGAIEYIHKQIVAQRDAGKAVLLVSLEMDEVLDVSDRILVMYEGEIVGQLDPKTTTPEEMGLYMAGAKREEV